MYTFSRLIGWEWRAHDKVVVGGLIPSDGDDIIQKYPALSLISSSQLNGDERCGKDDAEDDGGDDHSLFVNRVEGHLDTRRTFGLLTSKCLLQRACCSSISRY